MDNDKHSLNAQVEMSTYNTFMAIVKKDKKSTVNSYTDTIIEEFNKRWIKENPEKAKLLDQWIEDVSKKKNSATR